jgi:hypothetical protein
VKREGGLTEAHGARELPGMQACSACAGDYEDPDRAAGGEFEDLLAAIGEYEWQGDERDGDDLGGLALEE